ncbi:MAG: histidine kinase [Lachnospiraceae bacterium]|nr:histidine kinase [Lachnospiraceae bacterium]
MQNVKTGHPAVLEGETGTDEIGELISTYNYMVSQVNESMTREMQAQEEMSEMRLEILRAQIDPHFLYNTLDLLRGLSQKSEKQKVEELVLALTQFYRLALNRGEKFSTVEREIMQSESYMKIMNMRFGDQLNFVVDVADEILEYYVPVLIFQPILENAIIHGMLEKEVPSGNISLTGWREEDDLVFLISDDGVGIDEETMKAIMEGRKTSGKGSNIGAYNTARRLQLIYGEKDSGKADEKDKEINSEKDGEKDSGKAGEKDGKKRSGLSYHSEPGRGTDVEIRIPVTKEEEVQ